MNTNYIRLGSQYGGWYYPLGQLQSTDTVLLVGTGEDVSFDIELYRKSNCRTILVDPTPKASHHWEKLYNAAKNKMKFPINNDSNTDYRLENVDLSKIEFIKCALWGENREIEMFEPQNPDFVSHTAIKSLTKFNVGFVAKATTFGTLCNNLNINSLKFIKLDIEGAEEYVLIDILEKTKELGIQFLQVEFHPIDNIAVSAVIEKWTKILLAYGWTVVIKENSNVCFEFLLDGNPLS